MKTVMVIKHKIDYNYTLVDAETGEFLCERNNADDIIKELIAREALCVKYIDKMFEH